MTTSNTAVTLNDLFSGIEKLTLKGVNHPILENAMQAIFGFDWETEALALAVYEYAQGAMYFDNDPDINTWVEK